MNYGPREFDLLRGERRACARPVIIGRLIDMPYDRLDGWSQPESKSDNALPDGPAVGDPDHRAYYPDIRARH